MQKKYKFALLGTPIAHSLSPEIHRIFAEGCGIDIDYIKIETDKAQLKDAVERLKREGFSGFNCTMPLKEEIIKFWLPFGLPWIPVLIWLRPRIKLLYFKNDNVYFIYQFLACVAIAIPTIISQEYLVATIGKLTQLDNISQISQHDKTKYYSLKNYHIDKQHIAIQKTISITGKTNEYLNMFMYIAMPILDSNTDIVKFENKYFQN